MDQNLKNKIKHYITTNGIPAFQKETKQLIYEAVSDLVRRSMTLREIGETLKVSVATVSLILKGKFPVPQGRPRRDRKVTPVRRSKKKVLTLKPS